MPLLLQPHTEVLPGYRLVGPLGKGGFGEVWKCEAPGGLFKAVKIVRNKAETLDVPSSLPLSSAAGERGRGEGGDAELELQALETIRAIRHPFLLSMDRIEIVDGVLVVVMELADESLHDQLRHCLSAGRAGVPRDRLLARLAEAAEVLDLMNLRHRMLHLDVKPHNLLLVGGHVKVADFGLVSRLPPPTPALPHGGGRESVFLPPPSVGEGGGGGEPTCRPGVVSPVYASPEAFKGNPSAASDQYSLAVAYHELLTGELPFQAKSIRQMAVLHAQAEPDLDRLPAADRAAVARALSKDPSRRFLSCTQFVAALLAAEAVTQYQGADAPRSPAALCETRPTAAVDASTPGTDRHAAAPTAVLASCRFEECVTRGETIEVWTARTTEGRDCYVKFFHGLGDIDADARRDGLHLLQSVCHPGLVRYDLVRDEGGRLLAVLPRRGPTLRERWAACRAEGRRGVPRPELLAALKNVARTLDALGGRSGAPHLALNPDAVQLADGQALVADFGLAAWFWLPSGQPLADLNPRHAAPELGANAVSRFCDPYSLALVFQEMLTGVHPLGAGRPTARAYSQPDLRPLDAADRAVLARALDRAAARRFGSCLELIAALEEQARPASVGAWSGDAVGAGSPDHAPTDADPAAAILAEVVADAAAGWQLRKHGLFRYLLRPGDRLRHEFVARASRETAPGLLNDFCRRWEAELAELCDDALVYHAAAAPLAPSPLLGGRGRGEGGRGAEKSASWEIVLRFLPHAEPSVADVRVEARPVGCGPERAAQLLDEAGPALLDAFRTALDAHPDRRRQDRVPFDRPVLVRALAEDGTPGATLHARARNLSRTGVGLLLPEDPPGRRVLIYLPAGGDAPPVPVPSRLVRVHAAEDGYEAGALFLLGEGGIR